MTLSSLRRKIFGNTKTPHTWASELIAVDIVLIGAMEFYWAMPRLDRPDQAAVALFMGTASMLFGLFTARRNSFEGRLIAGVLAGSQVVILTLAFAWGLPGQEPYPTTLFAVSNYVFSAILLVLLVFDAQIRSALPRRKPKPPYAL